MASLYQRNKTYYAKVYLGGKAKRISLRTSSRQIAKEKLRQIESRLAQGVDNPLPTRTPIGQVVQAYVEHIRTVKTPKSAQTDIYYLREAFGACCEAVQVTSRTPAPGRLTARTRKRPLKPGMDRRCKGHVIEAQCFEAITTAEIQRFIDSNVRSRGLAPKTANRYREIICRLFNWSMNQGIIRLPGDRNPAARVERHKEKAPEIRFLTLAQIDEQLHVLRFKPRLQAMVAVLIYAGLRREELLWLTMDDVDLSHRNGGNGMIRVRAKTIDDGKGEGGRFWQPKTKRNRAVPISRALREHLDRYLPLVSGSASGSDSGATSGGGGWFFPAPCGGWMDPDNFSRELRRAQQEAGLRWACLDYRHTFGSQLAQKGISLFKIATLIGNSPEICRRHYASLIPDAMVGEVEFATAYVTCVSSSTLA